jgi:Flp pilus assembly protein TadG
MSIKGIRDWGLGIGESRLRLRTVHGPLSTLHSLHRDENGVMSVLSVFAMLALAILLGMVMNSGIQVDGKIRMQNAADAAAYSGAITLTRGMNTVAFTNHLLCEVFSLTAILREGNEPNEKEYVSKNLTAWKKVASQLSESNFNKFTQLATAIKAKTTSEQSVADTYLAWIKAVSDKQLSSFETVLSEELIPKFQRKVLQYYPEIAQEVAEAVSQLNGTPDHDRGTMHAALWRTSGELVAYPTLPVIDPTEDSDYLEAAKAERNAWAKAYLDQWNAAMMPFFDRCGGRMSQFGVLWRGFTCGQLNKLISEYENNNLPMQIQKTSNIANSEYLDAYLTVVGAAYWGKPMAFAPKLLKNLVASDSNVLITYAEARIFVPKAHLVYKISTAGTHTTSDTLGLGGVTGNDSQSLALSASTTTTTAGTTVVYQSVPTDWNMFNQHWVCQLVPATASGLATILQTAPSSVSGSLPAVGLTSEEIQTVSPH